MTCPNCKKGILKGAVCHNCGIDIIIFNKTNQMSLSLYNKGLAQAKIRDLSGAIESLTKSIEFNKDNCLSRNLLGLVYFEIGHLGDALKHWAISSSIAKESNLAKEYLDNLQNNSRALERYNDAIKMYNQALSYIRQKSDDMAIIQLKKAIEINPKFVDAMNLLIFCYLIQKEKDRAASLIERVLTIDINNPTTLNYYKEVHQSKGKPEPIQKIKKPVNTSQSSAASYNHLQAKGKKSFGENFHFAEILSFLIGVACTFAIIYILVIPSKVDGQEKEISQLKKDLITAEQNLYQSSTEKDGKISILEEDNARLKQENETLSSQVKMQEKLQKINSASMLFTSGEVVEAADLISSLDFSDLPADSVSTAEKLKQDVYPLAAKKIYDNALSKYNSRLYDEAKVLFEKSLIFAEPNVNYMDSIVYYMGSIYENTGDLDSAKLYYEKIVNDYPNSKHRTRARNSLRSFEQ